MELLEHTNINDYAIELKENKQLLHSPTYNLEPVELEILKTYIEKPRLHCYLQIKHIDTGNNTCNQACTASRVSLHRVGRSFSSLDCAKLTRNRRKCQFRWCLLSLQSSWSTPRSTLRPMVRQKSFVFLPDKKLCIFMYCSVMVYCSVIMYHFVVVYLNNILIYTKNLDQSHIKSICWVLNQLWKPMLFANLEKERYNQNEICFLGFVVSAYGVPIKNIDIGAVKTWPRLQSDWDI